MNLSFADLEKYKIVFSLFDLIDLNGLTSITCSEQMFKTLNNNFIGFVSYDNSHVIMRNLSSKTLPNMRYYNYNIFNDPTGNRFYVMPNKVDLLTTKINIIATEGIFDIIGVKEHVYYGKMDSSTIYTAICGTGFQNVIKKFAKMGFIDMNIHIYSDSDQGLNMYKSVKKQISMFTDEKIKISYNILSKDYGVPKENIKLKHSYL